MTGRAFICLTALAVLLVALSCAKLPEKPTKTQGAVVMVQMADKDAVPTGWGEAFAVSSEPSNPGWLQLWFRDTDGTVRMAAYNIRTNTLSREALIIQRR